MPSLIACNITGIFDTCTFGYLSDTERKTFTFRCKLTLGKYQLFPINRGEILSNKDKKTCCSCEIQQKAREITVI